MKKTIFIIFSIICYCLQAFAWDINPIYHIGNEKIYEKFIPEDTNLKGKKILFLGSSVTLGAASENFSFVDMLATKYQIIAVKDAVSGTTLVNNGNNSYISRLRKYTSADDFDLVVIQLSTNDAFQNTPLNGPDSIEAAINFIANYVIDELKSKVVFFTNPPLNVVGGGNRYAQMVELLNKIASERNFFVVDIFNEKSFTTLSSFDYGLYMYDHVHPTKAGYKVWLPFFEKKLFSIFGQIEK